MAPVSVFVIGADREMITEKMLYRGTAATIIMGAMPDEPYILLTKAMPKTARCPGRWPGQKRPPWFYLS